MIPIYSPASESESAVISAVLRAHEIPFFLRGGGLGKLYPGIQIKDYTTQTFMVPPEHRDLAMELLADFITPDKNESAAPNQSFSWTARVLFEGFFFGWAITDRRSAELPNMLLIFLCGISATLLICMNDPWPMEAFVAGSALGLFGGLMKIASFRESKRGGQNKGSTQTKWGKLYFIFHWLSNLLIFTLPFIFSSIPFIGILTGYFILMVVRESITLKS